MTSQINCEMNINRNSAWTELSQEHNVNIHDLLFICFVFYVTCLCILFKYVQWNEGLLILLLLWGYVQGLFFLRALLIKAYFGFAGG